MRGIPDYTRAALCISLLALAAGNAIGEETIEQAGKQHFLKYCAACHGENATGSGPYAGLLKKEPASLTELTKNNGGNFPFDKIYDMIDGREMLAVHGTREMPVWGHLWQRDTGDESRIGAEAAVRARTLELIVYIRSIQQ